MALQEKLPFIPGQDYRRRTDIHALYGGNWQSGISVSAKHPYIFIFTGKAGHAHGYQDGWDNPDVFTYTGEGQIGDMEFTRGNLALRDHLKDGKRVFLFENQVRGLSRFVGEVELFDADYFETKDREGKSRIGIKFFFKPKNAVLKIDPTLFNISEAADPPELYALEESIITERQGFVTSRVGQGAYRKRIIHRWQYKCAVTHFNRLDLLVASHIVPWSQANDNERLDVDNGILLSPTYDALFDRHLISFENNGQILLSELIEPAAFKKIAVTGQEKIREVNSYTTKYLERHRDVFSGQLT